LGYLSENTFSLAEELKISVYKVCPESPGDIPAIEVLVTAAFGGPAESKLIALIRQRKESLTSLVANDGDIVVGHVLMSSITLDGPGKFGGIAPLAVAPAHQKSGVGSLLMNQLLLTTRDEGFDALFLLGDPAYYARFGFIPSHINSEYGADDAFQHLELRPGCLAGDRGTARYVSAFAEGDV